MMMEGPPLNDLKRVALITRDQDQEYPRGALSAQLKAGGVTLVEGAGQPEIDLVIAMGGDGTVLRALCAYQNCPTLAVNFGRIGFLTQGDRDEFEPMVRRVLEGDYFIEHRLAIEVSLERAGSSLSSSVSEPSAREVNRERCINEVTLKGIAHMNELTLSIDGVDVHTMRGDGLIVGTPTGSTAYLMSTGAPLVTPGVNCFIASPLNEYRFSSRPMILPGESSLEIRVDHARPGDLRMIIDGGAPIPLEEGAHIKIKRSAHPTLLVAFEPQFFFKNLRERLNW